MTDIKDQQVLLVVSWGLGQHLLPHIHMISNLNAIYIMYTEEVPQAQWIKECSKIKGLYTKIEPICEALKVTVKQCNHDSIAMSFVPMVEDAFNHNLNQLEPSFMYTQLFKKTLLTIEYGEQSRQALLTYCRKNKSDASSEQKIIDEFERDYHPNKAIWWYTRECFTYQILNRALRLLDGDTIVNMGFFISDLHRQIERLQKKQISQYHGKLFIAYRGQRLLTADFKKLKKTNNGLASFNSFLSSSKNIGVPQCLARSAVDDTSMYGILFAMTIDSTITSTPFANIKEDSYFETEDEVLFSMHSVFRIGQIKSIDHHDRLFEVQLTLTADDDEQLRKLTDRFEEEGQNIAAWTRIGNLLIQVGQLSKAEELFVTLSEQKSKQGARAIYYHQLGCIKTEQGHYNEALRYVEQAHDIIKKKVPVNHSALATSYSSLGVLNAKMGQSLKALSFYRKALAIEQKMLPAYHPSLATSYNNVGMLHYEMGEYSRALSFYRQALDIFEKTLPTDHPSFANGYSNVGSVYEYRKEFSTALSFHNKALDIRQKTLPTNHPDVASSYNNIGMLHSKMREYSKALSFHEKALDVFEQTLPANHPSLAVSYSNIGSVYHDMSKYSKALSFHAKAGDIFEKTLPKNHPLFANFYNNVSLVYLSIDEYSTALSFYNNALDIHQKTLPANHPALANSYSIMAYIFEKTKAFAKALDYFERALDIQICFLPPHHSDIQSSRENIPSTERRVLRNK